MWYSLVEQLRETKGCEDRCYQSGTEAKGGVLDERMGPEIMARVRAFVEEIASRDYPLVWVAKPGMTEEDLSEFRKINEHLPVYMRAEPGEFIGVEGSTEGFQIPDVGGPRLNGLNVIKHLSGEMQEEDEAKLLQEVMFIYAAKQGKVVVRVSDEIAWVPKGQLTDDDMPWLVGIPGNNIDQNLQTRREIAIEALPPVVGIWTGTRTTAVPINELTPEEVDEDLLNDLEGYTAGETMGSFVIPETERVRAYLAKHGEYSG
jgi:hypothetical protein